MAKTLEQRKSVALDRLMAIDSARRGQLSEQFYAGKSADGGSKEQGPYYVWQRSVNGQKRSVRIPRDQVERVEAELERGEEVDAILDELWDILEQSAQEQDQQGKKKSRQSRKHASGRPKPLSI
jgi:hypothetical protein